MEGMSTSTPRFASHEIDIVRVLGRGAFGEVFLVQTRDADGRLLALKRVPTHQLSEAGNDKALAEARLLQQLGSEHDCILRCFDFRVLSGSSRFLELLLEFAPLGDLSRRIKLQKGEELGTAIGFPEPEIVAYGRDVASGLAHLHGLRPKVFHRDVKPANVVLFPARPPNLNRPRAKLADFGIAKLLESEGTFAGAATVIGTPHYFSPELCRGQRYDERADAWALGCILYEMICLHRPFHQVESNLALLAIRISEGSYDREALSRRARDYNGLLIFTLTELLMTDPEQRRRARDALESLESRLNEIEQSQLGLNIKDGEALDITPEVGPISSEARLQADNTDSWRPIAGVGEMLTELFTELPSRLPTPLSDELRVLESAARPKTPLTIRPRSDGTRLPSYLAPPAGISREVTTIIPEEASNRLGQESQTNDDTYFGSSTCVETHYLDESQHDVVDPPMCEASRLAWAGSYIDAGEAESPRVAEVCEPGIPLSPNKGPDNSHLAWPGSYSDAGAAESPRLAGVGEPGVPFSPSNGPENSPTGRTRLFMRPLRRDISGGKVPEDSAPVIFCFKRGHASNVTETHAPTNVYNEGIPPSPTMDNSGYGCGVRQECPTSAADGSCEWQDETVAHAGSTSTPVAMIGTAGESFNGWLQVALPGTADGLFSLTAVE